MIRTRFAPSPTGYLHLGGARTALFNYLLAKQAGGKFILRIEDTDLERSTPKATKAIFDSMEWLGLTWDEGPNLDDGDGPFSPYYQSQRLDIYKMYADDLIEKGFAYRCYCTQSDVDTFKSKLPLKLQEHFKYQCSCRLDKSEKDSDFCIKFYSGHPKVKTDSFQDLVFKTIDIGDIGDFKIMRSNGYPLYNFSAVIDDMLMEITHVVRGKDHLTNTASQVLLYKALDAALPLFAHLPMLMANKNEKLSKRHGAVSVIEYKDKGFSPQGLLSYLARFGWSYKDEELFTMEDLVAKFRLEDVGRSDGIFDIKKCNAINAKHLKTLTTEKDLIVGLAYHLNKLGIDCNEKAAAAILPFIKKYPNINQMAQASVFYFVSDIDLNDELYLYMQDGFLDKNLDILLKFVSNVDASSSLSINKYFNDLCREHSYVLTQLSRILTCCLTGSKNSFDIFSVIFLLGKDKSLNRLKSASAYVATKV